MATIVLDYDVHHVQAHKALDFIFSLGIFTEKKKKTCIEKACEDIEKGKFTFIDGLKTSKIIIASEKPKRKTPDEFY